MVRCLWMYTVLQWKLVEGNTPEGNTPGTLLPEATELSLGGQRLSLSSWLRKTPLKRKYNKNKYILPVFLFNFFNFLILFIHMKQFYQPITSDSSLLHTVFRRVSLVPGPDMFHTLPNILEKKQKFTTVTFITITNTTERTKAKTIWQQQQNRHI